MRHMEAPGRNVILVKKNSGGRQSVSDKLT
jgi:hypothetical protein